MTISRRQVILGLVAVSALAAVAVLAVVARERPTWTTRSDEALAEFEAGLRDETKFYEREAVVHYERAAELDPEFLMPKLKLIRRLRMIDRERVRALVDDLEGRDLRRVTPRERLLVGSFLAEVDKRPEEAEAMLTAYLAEHPEDPYAIDLRCAAAWESHAWDEAEACYRRLIAADPNWVEAQNRLGYTAMARGEFAAAEEQFRIYGYLAPDQPNPHDSLGELLLLIGRWREASDEFEEALAIKPDFCPSWGNLVQLDLFEAEYERADRRVARAREAGACDPQRLALMGCRVQMWQAYGDERWAEVLAAAGEPACRRHFGDTTVLSYQVALAGDSLEAAEGIERRVHELATEYEDDQGLAAMLHHLNGIRLRHRGEPEAAVEELRQADAVLNYWAGGQGYFKLVNRHELWAALAEAGREAEAERVMAEIRSVNRELADRWAAARQPPAAADAAAAAR